MVDVTPTLRNISEQLEQARQLIQYVRYATDIVTGQNKLSDDLNRVLSLIAEQECRLRHVISKLESGE